MTQDIVHDKVAERQAIVDGARVQAAEQDAARWLFEREYKRSYRPPPPPRVWGWLPWHAFPVGLVGLSASLMAALRTGPVFTEIAALTLGNSVLAGIEGVLGVLSVDVAVITFAFVVKYLRTKSSGKAAKVTWLMQLGLWLSIVTQLAAQLFAVRDLGVLEAVVQSLGTAIGLAMALSAAVLAYVTGEVLAVLVINAQAARADLRAEYEAADEAWWVKFRAAWTRRQKELGLLPDTRSRTVLEPQERGSGSRRGSSDVRLYPSHRKVIRVIRENPDAIDWNRAELAEAAGIKSKGVASEAVKAVLNNPELLNSMNGNHKKKGI